MAAVVATLTGRGIPDIALPATDGRAVYLSRLDGVTVVYAYPRTSPLDAPPIPGWDMIPGAKGCTPQSCAFRDHHADLLEAGASSVFGLSVQDTAYQTEVVERLHLPFALLSDSGLRFAEALGMPRFSAGGMELLERLTLIFKDGHVVHAMHPVTNPAANAVDVVAWLSAQSASVQSND